MKRGRPLRFLSPSCLKYCLVYHWNVSLAHHFIIHIRKHHFDPEMPHAANLSFMVPSFYLLHPTPPRVPCGFDAESMTRSVEACEWSHC